jgi:hypothetical protein
VGLLLAAGGHGVPGDGLIPGEGLVLPWLPGVGGFGLDVFGVEPDAPFAVPGKVPQGEPLGAVPGVLVVLGLTVEGCVVFPGVGELGEVDPGAVVFGFPLGEVEPGFCPGVVCGVAVPAGGVAVRAGGVAGLAGGVAVLAGGVAGLELCPSLLEPPAGAAPPGELWATAQLAQHNTTDSHVSFRDDMSIPPGVLIADLSSAGI